MYKKNVIDVHINRATLDSFAVDVKGKVPEIDARLTLYAGDKMITSVTLGTGSWRDVHMDLPISIMTSVGKIVKELESIAKTTFMQTMKQLDGEVK